MTRTELVKKAQELGVKGCSKMNMVQLEKAIEIIENNKNNKGDADMGNININGENLEVDGSLEEMIDAMNFGAGAAESIPEFTPFIPGASEPAPNPPTNTPASTSADGLTCSHCKGKITQGVIDYCKKNYPDKVAVCMSCQKKLNYAGTAECADPLCPECKEKHITKTIADYCAKWYPGKVAVCVSCQKKLKYVAIKPTTTNAPVNNAPAATSNCNCTKCNRPLSAREVKFNQLNGLTPVCFAHAEVKAVLSFNRDETKPYYTVAPVSNAPTAAPVSTGTGVHCDICNKELSQGVIIRNHNLWINRPEFEEIHFCANCLIEKGLLKDSMKK